MKRQPPGFRFQPTHVELVMFYLKRKVMQKKLPTGVISELDIYKYAPWDLPDKSCMKSGDLKWYFFCPIKRKHVSGTRKNRTTKFGFWKSTGNDMTVFCNKEKVGHRKTLTFFRGKALDRDHTDWVMHEYRIEEKNPSLQNVAQDTYVLCVIFQKDGPGPRNGAQYGAPFNEEDWNDYSPEDVVISSGLSVLPSKEPSNSFAPDSSTTPSNIFGCSSVSYITENLASTSKEIPQIASRSIALEIPQNLDNVDDGITMEDLFPNGNSNFNDADGFQKDGPGPRNGAQCGAPFNEEDWNDYSPEDVDISSGLSVLPSKEPSNSFAPDSSTTPSNIFGCSSVSYITENLASTSKEIPQIASGSIALEIPQNLDNLDDGITMEDLFRDENSNFNDADGFQATVAASNDTDRIDDFFEGSDNIGGWFDVFNGDGNAYITGHQVIHSSEQTCPINREIISSDPGPFLELTDLDIPLSQTYQDLISFLELDDLNATYNRYSVNEPCFPFSSFGAANNPGYPDAHMSASSQFAGLQENVPPNSNEGYNGF